MLNFIAWQMLLGVLPLCAAAARAAAAGNALERDLRRHCCCGRARRFAAFGFVLWVGVLRFLPAGTASLNMLAIPVIALVSSMAVFDERLSTSEWIGIGCIGAGLVVISFRAWLATRRGERPPPEPIPLEGG